MQLVILYKALVLWLSASVQDNLRKARIQLPLVTLQVKQLRQRVQ
jgi:hypothetical protein